MLDHALDLARRGFRVFPLVPGTKRPAIERWQDLATTDEATIRAAWAQREWNIGVATGHGLLGIDIDVKNGKDGEASFAALGLTAEDLDTLTVRTPSGGRHVYFRLDDVHLGNSAGSIGSGLDSRGEGGFLVGPGSALANGSGRGAYTIEHEAALRPLPAGLRQRLEGQRKGGSETRRDGPLVDLDDAGSVLRSRSWLQDDASAALEAQGGDHTTLTVAMRLKDFGVSEDVAFELMLDHWNERCEPPWEPEALKTKVENAYRYGQNPPGSDHPSFLFAGVSVDAPPQPNVERSKWFRHAETYDVSEASWTFYNLFPAVGTAVIVGPSNSGKTFLEIEMARCLGTGKPFFTIEPDEIGGTVFLFAGTEGSAMDRRLAALQEDHALPISATSVQDLSGRGALTALYDTVKEEAERMEILFGVPLRMVVLETLSASGLLLDENSNAEAGRAMSNLGKLAEMLNVVFVTTHHPPKEGRGTRGAGAITASADYVLEIFREGRDTLRRLELVKARDAEQRMIGTFSLVPVQLGVDRKGRPVTSMSVSMGEAIKSTPGRTPPKLKEFQQAIEFAYIEAAQAVDGEQMIEKQAGLDSFKDHFPDMDRSQRHRLWQKCLDYATDMGTMESRVVHGVHYLLRKEIT